MELEHKNGQKGDFCGQTLVDVPKTSAVFFLFVVVNSHYRQTSGSTYANRILIEHI